jgi:hypothetical protein
VRRGVLGEIGPDSPVSLAASLDAAVMRWRAIEARRTGCRHTKSYCRYSGTRSRSQLTAVASHPSLPGSCTSCGQPGGMFRTIITPYHDESNWNLRKHAILATIQSSYRSHRRHAAPSAVRLRIADTRSVTDRPNNRLFSIANVLVPESEAERRAREAREAAWGKFECAANLALVEFLRTTQWPQRAPFRRKLNQKKLHDPSLEQMLDAMPRSFWERNMATPDQFILTLQALQELPKAQALLGVCMAIVQRAYQLYSSDTDDELKLQSDDSVLLSAAGGDADLLLCALEVLDQHPPSPLGGGGSNPDSGTWFKWLHEDVMPDFREVATVQDYLAAQGRIAIRTFNPGSRQTKLSQQDERRSATPESPNRGVSREFRASAVPAKIFISYRRADASWPARWLADRLAAQFGADVVFQDMDSIRPGDDFAGAIEAAVGACAVMVAIIGPQWLAVEGDAGPRLDDPQDWVRLEIEAALKRKVRVIPVLVDGARMPAAAELPPSLQGLVRRQAVALSPASLDTRKLESIIRTVIPYIETQPERELSIATEPERPYPGLDDAPDAHPSPPSSLRETSAADAKTRADTHKSPRSRPSGPM